MERRGVRAVIPRRESKAVSLWKNSSRVRKLGRIF